MRPQLEHWLEGNRDLGLAGGRGSEPETPCIHAFPFDFTISKPLYKDNGLGFNGIKVMKKTFITISSYQSE